jgi:hypothetical protein
MAKTGRKRRKRSLMEVVNDRNWWVKKKKVIDGGCQRPKPAGKEEKGH